MSETKNPFPIDPKELAPMGAGLAIGLLVLALFLGLVLVLGLPTIPEHWDMPRQ